MDVLEYRPLKYATIQRKKTKAHKEFEDQVEKTIALTNQKNEGLRQILSDEDIMTIGERDKMQRAKSFFPDELPNQVDLRTLQDREGLEKLEGKKEDSSGRTISLTALSRSKPKRPKKGMIDNLLASKVGMSLTKKIFSEVTTHAPDEFHHDAKKPLNKDETLTHSSQESFYERTEREYREKRDKEKAKAKLKAELEQENDRLNSKMNLYNYMIPQPFEAIAKVTKNLRKKTSKIPVHVQQEILDKAEVNDLIKNDSDEDTGKMRVPLTLSAQKSQRALSKDQQTPTCNTLQLLQKVKTQVPHQRKPSELSDTNPYENRAYTMKSPTHVLMPPYSISEEPAETNSHSSQSFNRPKISSLTGPKSSVLDPEQKSEQKQLKFELSPEQSMFDKQPQSQKSMKTAKSQPVNLFARGLSGNPSTKYQESMTPSLNVLTFGSGAVRSDFGKFTKDYNTGKSQLLETYEMNLEQRERMILLKKLMGGWQLDPQEREVLHEYVTNQMLPKRDHKQIHTFFDLEDEVMDKEDQGLTIDGKPVRDMNYQELRDSMLGKSDAQTHAGGSVKDGHGGVNSSDQIDADFNAQDSINLTEVASNKRGRNGQLDSLDLKSLQGLDAKGGLTPQESLQYLSQKPRMGSPPYTSKNMLRLYGGKGSQSTSVSRKSRYIDFINFNKKTLGREDLPHSLAINTDEPQETDQLNTATTKGVDNSYKSAKQLTCIIIKDRPHLAKVNLIERLPYAENNLRYNNQKKKWTFKEKEDSINKLRKRKKVKRRVHTQGAPSPTNRSGDPYDPNYLKPADNKTTLNTQPDESLNTIQEYAETDSEEELKATTVDELVEENLSLRGDVQTQLAIFEQYLKVAILQHRANEIEKKKIKKQQEPATAFEFSGGLVPFYDHSRQESSVDTVEVQQADTTRQTNQTSTLPAASSKNSHMRIEDDSRSPTLKPTSSRSNLTRRKTHGTANSSKRISTRNLKVTKTQDPYTEKLQRPQEIKSAAITPTSASHRFIVRGPFKFAYDSYKHLLRKVSKKQNYTPQIEYMMKVEALWKQLEQADNPMLVDLENELIAKRAYLDSLREENNKGWQLYFKGHRQYAVTAIRQSKKPWYALQTQERKEIAIKLKIQKANARRDFLSQWGVQSLIMQLVIKCRLTERLIILAQNLQCRPDHEVEQEKKYLKQLIHQTYEDLRHYIRKRDLKPWRTWDKYHLIGQYYKPIMQAPEKSFEQMCNEYDELAYWVDQAEDCYQIMVEDIQTSDIITHIMMPFTTYHLGNKGWQRITSSLHLHKKQYETGKAFEPSIAELVFKIQNPYPQGTEQNVAYASKLAKKMGYSGLDEIKKLASPEPPTPMKKDISTKTTLKKKLSMVPEKAEEDSFAEKKDDLDSSYDYYEEDADDKKITKSKSEYLVKPKFDFQEDSKWQQTLKREQTMKEQRQKEQREERAARLAKLFDESEDEDDKQQHQMDSHAVGASLQSYIDKVDNHLMVEMNVIQAWKQKDAQDSQERMQRIQMEKPESLKRNPTDYIALQSSDNRLAELRRNQTELNKLRIQKDDMQPKSELAKIIEKYNSMVIDNESSSGLTTPGEKAEELEAIKARQAKLAALRKHEPTAPSVPSKSNKKDQKTNRRGAASRGSRQQKSQKKVPEPSPYAGKRTFKQY